MSGLRRSLRAPRPAATAQLRLVWDARGVTGRLESLDGRAGNSMPHRIISFHSAGEAFVPSLNEVTVGQLCFPYLSFLGRREARV